MSTNKEQQKNIGVKSLKLTLLFLGAVIASMWVVLWYAGFFNSHSHTDLSKKIINSSYNYSQTAYFAGGCFWCMEGIFEAQDGVEGAYSGYTGGKAETATYEETSSKTTDHREAVRVVYDPDVISYRMLVELFWTQINPTDDGGQFNDRGFVYSTAIYYSNMEEKIIAQQSKNDLEVSKRFNQPIVTSIEATEEFYDAEEYHQDYYKKNPIRYKLYTSGSGRKEFIAENWQERIDELDGKKYVNGKLVENTQSQKKSQVVISDEKKQQLKEALTQMQYKVTVEHGTEPAFDNEYWDNKEAGIYVDIIDGTALYSSQDKFDSGTGWPSFTKGINDENLVTSIDTRFFMTRTEVSSATSGAHLGHIFEDAPQELGGIRHCINSAALRFIPVEDLEAEGYGEYVEMFE